MHDACEPLTITTSCVNMTNTHAVDLVSLLDPASKRDEARVSWQLVRCQLRSFVDTSTWSFESKPCQTFVKCLVDSGF